jgi:hypothetical protein
MDAFTLVQFQSGSKTDGRFVTGTAADWSLIALGVSEIQVVWVNLRARGVLLVPPVLSQRPSDPSTRW